jgi:hypothetical protein
MEKSPRIDSRSSEIWVRLISILQSPYCPIDLGNTDTAILLNYIQPDFSGLQGQ